MAIGGDVDAVDDEWLPPHAVINFDVARNPDGTLKKDDAARVEFHANMGPGSQALLLFSIRGTKQTDGNNNARLYKAKVVDLKNARDPKQAAAAAAGASAGAAEPLPATTLFFIHGFNTNVTGVFDNCRRYRRAHPHRVVVPVLWADHQLGICGYVPDRVTRVDPAGHAIADFVSIANHWAFPRRALVCHSMGNYVLQKHARDAARSAGTMALAFDADTFMVAADVSDRIFDERHNNRTDTNKSDGLSILKLATNRVHVLHSSDDPALQVRVVPNCGQRALGARGYNEGRLLVDAIATKLSQVDCSNPTHYPRRDGHSYQFEGWAMQRYEDAMNA